MSLPTGNTGEATSIVAYGIRDTYEVAYGDADFSLTLCPTCHSHESISWRYHDVVA